MKKLVLLCLSCILACACGGGGSSAPACVAREAGAGEIAINNATQLADMALSGKYILTSDISLAGLNWMPIGDSDDLSFNPTTDAFTGELDGNCYTITGLTINSTGTGLTINSTGLESVGLFTALDGAKISNLILKDVNITADNVVAIMAGSIAGYADNSEITNSYSTGAIVADSGYVYVGGLLASVVGGKVTNSHSTVSIEAQSVNSVYAGGIVGFADGVTVTNSYSAGAISADGDNYAIAGGIVGVAETTTTTVSNSYSTGAISANSDNYAYAGGIVSFASVNTKVENCVAINPSVSAADWAGRIIGDKYSATANNNIALDSMIAGGAAFDSSDPISHGTDATIAALLSQSTYSTLGWDFTNIWKMDNSISKYPVLIWQE